MNFIEACKTAFSELHDKLSIIKNDVDEFSKMCEPQGIGYGGDTTRGFDILAEQIFTKHLSVFGRIFSEEAGMIGAGSSTVILDPIDGSDNLRVGIPYYGSSISLVQNDKTVASFVGNLATGECFCKTDIAKWRCTVYDDTIREMDQLPASQLVGVGVFEKAYGNPDTCKVLNDMGIKFRSPGALALSLAYSYRFDFLLFCGMPRKFDIDAGLHLCENANIYQTDKHLLVSRNTTLFEKLKSSLCDL